MRHKLQNCHKQFCKVNQYNSDPTHLSQYLNTGRSKHPPENTKHIHLPRALYLQLSSLDHGLLTLSIEFRYGFQLKIHCQLNRSMVFPSAGRASGRTLAMVSRWNACYNWIWVQGVLSKRYQTRSACGRKWKTPSPPVHWFTFCLQTDSSGISDTHSHTQQ